MIIWNFNTPVTFLASCFWNLCESLHICVPKAHIVFGLVIGCKSKKIKGENK